MISQRSLLLFEQSIKSEVTKTVYRHNLDYFRKFHGIDNYDSMVKIEPKNIQKMVEDYVFHLKEKMSPNSIPTRIFPIQTFFEVNDIIINWKKIRRFFPAKVKKSGHKAWTTQEIQKMLECTSSLRHKAIIHFFASTGVRVGALESLKLKHINDIANDCKSVLIYANDPEEYCTFLTPEASTALNRYLQEREEQGEKLHEDSPLFCQDFKRGSKTPILVKTSRIRNMIKYVEVKAGLRTMERKMGNRYDVQSDHGFRKRFNTILKLNNSVNGNLVEKMLGHKRGLDGVYLTPTKDELFLEFMKAIPDLTIDEASRLRVKNKHLKIERSEYEKQSEEIEKLKKMIRLMQITQPIHIANTSPYTD